MAHIYLPHQAFVIKTEVGMQECSNSRWRALANKSFRHDSPVGRCNLTAVAVEANIHISPCNAASAFARNRGHSCGLQPLIRREMWW